MRRFIMLLTRTGSYCQGSRLDAKFGRYITPEFRAL
jgi:hypothetical protein